MNNIGTNIDYFFLNHNVNLNPKLAPIIGEFADIIRKILVFPDIKDINDLKVNIIKLIFGIKQRTSNIVVSTGSLNFVYENEGKKIIEKIDFGNNCSFAIPCNFSETISSPIGNFIFALILDLYSLLIKRIEISKNTINIKEKNRILSILENEFWIKYKILEKLMTIKGNPILTLLGNFKEVKIKI